MDYKASDKGIEAPKRKKKKLGEKKKGVFLP